MLLKSIFNEDCNENNDNPIDDLADSHNLHTTRHLCVPFKRYPNYFSRLTLNPPARCRNPFF
jgi:hypothetical protein